jgi:cysteine-rich repeat protein
MHRNSIALRASMVGGFIVGWLSVAHVALAVSPASEVFGCEAASITVTKVQPQQQAAYALEVSNPTGGANGVAICDDGMGAMDFYVGGPWPRTHFDYWSNPKGQYVCDGEIKNLASVDLCGGQATPTHDALAHVAEAVCGDGIIDPNETSDDGTDCVKKPAVCGDYVVEDGETCDDGDNNGVEGYCNSSCSGVVAVPVCGNGVRENNEACDDGNYANGDGCSAGCGIESGYTCDDASPSYCHAAAICGNDVCEEGEDTGSCPADCAAAYITDAQANAIISATKASGKKLLPLFPLGLVIGLLFSLLLAMKDEIIAALIDRVSDKWKH